MIHEEVLRRLCASGLVALTGPEEGPPCLPPMGLVEGMDALWDRLCALAIELEGNPLSGGWEERVAGRAALLGFGRRGMTSANSSCRLLRTSNGVVAVNLPRVDDVATLGALLEQPIEGDHWEALERWVSKHPSQEVVDRGQLLGLAVAELGSSAEGGVRRSPLPAGACVRSLEGAMVVNLSSLWAGPLTAALLGEVGMDVVHVESTNRPDGARGEPAFFEWLHGPSHRHLTFDFSQQRDLGALGELIDSADVIIEGSRPRALEHLGLDAAHRRLRSGAIWVSITGYGRDHPQLIAFGDDAAVAGGLVGHDEEGAPVFCGDAIADPITGITAAGAVLEAWKTGGGEFLDISLAASAASVLTGGAWPSEKVPVMKMTDEGWLAIYQGENFAIREPSVPSRRVS